jgi:hypothetical protein
MAVISPTGNFVVTGKPAVTKSFPPSVRRGGYPRPAAGQLWPRGVPVQSR